MHAQGNTGPEAVGNQKLPFVVRDEREQRFGLCFLSDIDSDDFRGLTGAAVRVYMVLTVFASKGQREAYPAQRRLGQITGLKRETVNRAIKQLCEHDFLRKRKAAGRTVYTLITHPGDSK